MSRWFIDRRRAILEILGGGLLVFGGVLLTLYSYVEARPGGSYFVLNGVVGAGLSMFVRGVVELVPWDPKGSAAHPGLEAKFHLARGYKSFVAWRYLLVNPRRVSRRVMLMIAAAIALRFLLWVTFGVGVAAPAFSSGVEVAATALTIFAVVVVVFGVLRFSKPAFMMFWSGVVLGVTSIVSEKLLVRGIAFPTSHVDVTAMLQVLSIVTMIGFALAGLALFFGVIRAFFTFFTTVPIGGVWIGTAALVCVLAVMSGFETDLREKILGSNAHIQITREDGDFVEWREAKNKVDKVPGVVASTPYAVSEVVIAAHNNGMNVIIKGIDPQTVGKVTDLVFDLEDREAMQRLAPLVDDSHDREVPQKPRPSGAVIDPPPADMPSAGDPIDFSAHDPAPSPAENGAGSDAAGSGSDADLYLEPPPDAFGGDARPSHPEPGTIIDPPPPDLLSSDEPPVDFSGSDRGSAIRVIDVPTEPTLSRRTQALPGVLVGRELVKQTHLYTGEEVRVVSPLSDPSNPDATGTPIPFNRDYRVAGVFYTGMYEYDLKYVYVSLDSLQDFLDRGDAVDGIEVRIEDADDTEAFVRKLHAALGPGYRIQDWHELNRSLFSALKLEKIAMFLVLGIVILVASFSIVGNLIMVVVEKAREIALLKTLGASDVGVMQLFAIQGLLIGVIGTTLGVLTGLLGCWAGKRFGLPLNPDVYYIDRLPIHVDPQSVAAAAAAGILISIAATLYPALLAARVRPAAGMRH